MVGDTLRAAPPPHTTSFTCTHKLRFSNLVYLHKLAVPQSSDHVRSFFFPNRNHTCLPSVHFHRVCQMDEEAAYAHEFLMRFMTEGWMDQIVNCYLNSPEETQSDDDYPRSSSPPPPPPPTSPTAEKNHNKSSGGSVPRRKKYKRGNRENSAEGDEPHRVIVGDGTRKDGKRVKNDSCFVCGKTLQGGPCEIQCETCSMSHWHRKCNWITEQEAASGLLLLYQEVKDRSVQRRQCKTCVFRQHITERGLVDHSVQFYTGLSGSINTGLLKTSLLRSLFLLLAKRKNVAICDVAAGNLETDEKQHQVLYRIVQESTSDLERDTAPEKEDKERGEREDNEDEGIIVGQELLDRLARQLGTRVELYTDSPHLGFSYLIAEPEQGVANNTAKGKTIHLSYRHDYAAFSRPVFIPLETRQ